MSGRYVPVIDKDTWEIAASKTSLRDSLVTMASEINRFFQGSSNPRVIVTVNENGKALLDRLKDFHTVDRYLHSEDLVIHITIDDDLVIDCDGLFPRTCDPNFPISVVLLGGVCSSGRRLRAVQQFIRQDAASEVDFRTFVWVSSIGSKAVTVNNALVQASYAEDYFWSGAGLNNAFAPKDDGRLYRCKRMYFYENDIEWENKNGRNLVWVH